MPEISFCKKASNLKEFRDALKKCNEVDLSVYRKANVIGHVGFALLPKGHLEFTCDFGKPSDLSKLHMGKTSKVKISKYVSEKGDWWENWQDQILSFLNMIDLSINEVFRVRSLTLLSPN